MSDNNARITDEDLTAYLDDAADPALSTRIETAISQDDDLAARLRALTVPMAALKDGFALPRLAPPAYKAPDMPAPTSAMSSAVMPLALAASFAVGMLLMTALRPATSWVDTVASYQALYVTETLRGATQTPDMSETVLQTAQDLLGVDLRGATHIAGLTFKRAQILAIDGKPLIQMAYLDADGTPFAFCVAGGVGADTGVVDAMSHQLATTSWVADGVGYVLVGGKDATTVRELSAELRQLL